MLNPLLHTEEGLPAQGFELGGAERGLGNGGGIALPCIIGNVEHHLAMGLGSNQFCQLPDGDVGGGMGHIVGVASLTIQ